jgi:hypothetical protein
MGRRLSYSANIIVVYLPLKKGAKASCSYCSCRSSKLSVVGLSKRCNIYERHDSPYCKSIVNHLMRRMCLKMRESAWRTGNYAYMRVITIKIIGNERDFIALGVTKGVLGNLKRAENG